MRLSLDAHLSHRLVAEPLRVHGHDVRSLQESPELDGLADEDVLVLAAVEIRIVVTRNSRDFAPLTRRWHEAGRDHAGCILIWSLDHDDHARIVAGVERLVATFPRQEDWQNLVLAI